MTDPLDALDPSRAGSYFQHKTGCIVEGLHRVPIDCVTAQESYLYHVIDEMRPIVDAAMAWWKSGGDMMAQQELCDTCRKAEEVERG